MFNVEEGGVSTPVKWDKDNLQPDCSIIILDESSLILYLWHGVKQGLVARRTALRQAQSLKGHGFTLGKSIIGRDIKELKEIDARKVGRVPEETEINEELQSLLNREYRELDNFVVTFSVSEVDMAAAPKPKAKAEPKPEPKPEVKPEPKPEPKPEVKPEPKPEPKPEVKPEPKPAPAATPAPATAQPKKASDLKFASEYDTGESIPEPAVKLEPKSEPKAAPAVVKPAEVDIAADAKAAFVIKAISDQFNDIWVSRKEDGSYAIEQMDGPVASFSIEQGNIKFTSGSFTETPPNTKAAVQKKFVELSKLL